MKFGHRGGNHPVRELATGKIEITSQNHSFAVDEGSLQGTGLILTHQNLLDGTAEGVACLPDKLFSVQYHPESAPGPQDSSISVQALYRLDGRGEEACLSARIFTSILVIGSGPIVIGQAAEFDYAGTQACLALQRGRVRGHSGQLQPRHHHDGRGHR